MTLSARKIIFWFSILALPTLLNANAAQPGMWQAGGTGTFVLLNPEDAAAFQKIQMVKERISVILHPGFAVVKGQYWMVNTSDSLIHITSGYPVNSSMQSNSSTLMQVSFDDLYQLQVFSEGKEQQISRDSIEIDHWYTWKNSYLPQDTTLLEVYFLVNTNTAQVLQGYTKEYPNGFIYLLESGATWKQPIGQGDILIQLAGGLTFEDIDGIHADPKNLTFSPTENRFWYTFQNLSPQPSDNLVLRYGERLPDFDFAKITASARSFFQEADQLSSVKIEPSQYEPRTFADPFDVTSPFSGANPYFAIGKWLLSMLCIGIFFYFFILKPRRRKG